MLLCGRWTVILGFLTAYSDSKKPNVCGDHRLLSPRGDIKSPKYPFPSPHVHCSWSILKPPNSLLTLVINDIDIEEDHNCTVAPCCTLNHLSLSYNESDVPTRYCGNYVPKGPIHVKQSQTVIRYTTSSNNTKSRGFNLSYTIDGCAAVGKVSCDSIADPQCYDNRTQRCDGVKDCDSGKDELGCNKCNFNCRTGGCYTAFQRCDGNADCFDFTDEIGCEGVAKYQAWCNKDKDSYFNPVSQQCDGINNCPRGEDENGCSCFMVSENCQGEGLCFFGSRSVQKCSNEKCLLSTLWCDGNNDCGDNSDEENCLRNSVISATIMGCLLCGLMLVIAVMCALRIHAIRNEASNYRVPLPQHVAARLNASMNNSISLPALVNDEFFHREPPPAYSVAVGDEWMLADRGSRRSRNRCVLVRLCNKPPTPPPPLVLEPSASQSTDTSNHSSPSRDSITSSSYLSNDDSTHLIAT